MTRSHIRGSACEVVLIIHLLHYHLEAIICRLPCSLCRCRAQRASCKARRPLPWSVGPHHRPAAPSAGKAKSWPSRGWLYVCTDKSCLGSPRIQRKYENILCIGKGFRTTGFGKESTWAALQPLPGKVLMGTMRRLSDENHPFTVSCILRSGQSCPQSRTWSHGSPLS